MPSAKTDFEGGFQYIGFPRCAIMSQDLKDSEIYFPRCAIMFQDLKDSKTRFSENTKVPRSSKIMQQISQSCQTSVRCRIHYLLRCQDDQTYFRISNILLRFHHVGFPFCLKTIVNADCLGPTENNVHYYAPTLSKISKHWPSICLDTALSDDFKIADFVSKFH